MNEHVIVALVATRGLEDFLENSLTGLIRVGVDPRIVHVARPDNAADTIDPIILKFGAVVDSFAAFGQAFPAAMPDQYFDYGTEPFIAVNWEKVRYIRRLLDRYRHVVYADLDVGWLADPLWYLDAVAKFYPLAFQTEALRRFPPVLCWGFLSAKSSNATLRLFDALLSDYDARPPGQAMVDEQDAGCDDHDKPGPARACLSVARRTVRQRDRLSQSPERPLRRRSAARQDRTVCVSRQLDRRA